MFFDFHTFSDGGSGFSCPHLLLFVVFVLPSVFPVAFCGSMTVSRYDGFRLDSCFIFFEFQWFSIISVRYQMVGLAFRVPICFCSLLFVVPSVLPMAFRRFPDEFAILWFSIGKPIVLYRLPLISPKVSRYYVFL